MHGSSPSAFETAVFRWIASRSGDPALRAQLEHVQIRERESTGCGCYSKLALSGDAPTSTADFSDRGPVFGPDFCSSAVEFGGGTLLWFRAGLAHTLEIYANGSRFPAEHPELGEFTFSGPSTGS